MVLLKFCAKLWVYGSIPFLILNCFLKINKEPYSGCKKPAQWPVYINKNVEGIN